MDKLGIDYNSILPEIITAAAGIVIMMIDAILRRSQKVVYGVVALAGLAGSTLSVLSLRSRIGVTSFRGMIINDELRLVFALIFLTVTFLTVLISLHWIEEEALPMAEFFALLMFATTGMLFMAAAGDLVMVFLGLEITSISSYVLCGYRRRDTRSNEAAMKYFILGSFSTAFLLYGMALVYGASFNPSMHPSATTNLQLLKDRIAGGQLFSPALLLAGAAMMIVGFGFKVSTAPFHIWSPDVYEGAPTPVTAFLSTGSKAAAFASFSRVFILTFGLASMGAGTGLVKASGVLSDIQLTSTHALYAMSVLTMFLGNITAVVQSNIKRMLAYSSIAHAGYALVGLVAGDWRAVAFYLISYVVINIGAFAIIEIMARKGDKRTEIADYSGVGFQSLALASALSLFLLSLAGIPLTAGFMAKLLVFKSAWGSGLHGLVIIGVINSAISWYYYLRVIVVMFFSEPAKGFVKPIVARSFAAAVVIMVLATLYLGILPGRVLSSLEQARNEAIAHK
jgi:NADH-quinone oxidoreductase subunit N